MSSQTALKQTSAPPVVIATSNVLINEIVSLFSWWYVEMPAWYLGFVQRIFVICNDTFSISLLFKTFFVPWHRDNSWIGVFFGIVVRIVYLPIVIAITAAVMLSLLIFATAWAFLPPFAVYSLIRTPFM